MAQFDVYERSVRGKALLLLDVQCDLLDPLETRVVIPLLPLDKAKHEVAKRLKPVLPINGEDYVLMTTDISAQLQSSLGKPITNIENPHRDTIIAAIDFLILGF